MDRLSDLNGAGSGARLVVAGLGKSFQHRVLDEVSFTLQAGSLAMLLGENGSGKTTLFGCLLDLHPHDGRAEWVDEAGQRPAHTAAFGTFDSSSLYPRWTVRANINYQLNRSGGHREDSVRELVPEPLLSKRAKTLSVGQTKIVMLAIALASGAQVLLLDEFSNGLDQRTRKRVRHSLLRARDDRRVVLMTGHDLGAFDGLPDRVLAVADTRVTDVTASYHETGSLEQTYASSLG